MNPLRADVDVDRTRGLTVGARVHRAAIGLAGVVAAIAASAMAGGGDGCIADLNGDGRVDGADLAQLLGGWGQPGPTDLNGSGTTDGADLSILLSSWGECPGPALEITLVPGSESVDFVAGASAATPFEVVVSGLTEPIEIVVAQSGSPAGLSISNDLPGGSLLVSADGTVVFNTTISGTSEGLFELSTLATWAGGDANTTIPVSVLPAGDAPVLSPLGAEPGAVNGGATTSVVFSIAVSGGGDVPTRFDLRRTDAEGSPFTGVVAELRDDGVSPDLVAGDGVYSGSANLDPAANETVRYYRAIESTSVAGSGLESEVLALPVSSFPIGTAPSDPDAVVEAPDGTAIYSNQIFVSFIAGTSDARIAEIAAQFGGVIAGFVPAAGGYQMSIPGDGTAQGVLEVIAQMKTVVDIDIVEPLFPTYATELVPNDPLYPGQFGVQAIRSAEAWTIAKGTIPLAIVDTGVDPAHPDLADTSGTRVVLLPGADIVGGGGDLSGDADGHGTCMAGIAAATGDNAIGIAGVAWASPIVAVRGLGGSSLDLAEAIAFAAARGVKVINVSGGVATPSEPLEKAVLFAREQGSLVIASSGSVPGEPFYPCAYESVLCIGAVDDQGAPLPDGGTGAWVDLAAPGQAVPCTEAGGGYGASTGTSPAAALVSGAAAAVWSLDPAQSAEEVRTRLLAGATPFAEPVGLGAGRADLFASAFDGGFELPGLATWITEGTVAVVGSFGPILPTEGDRMAYLATGGGTSPRLVKEFAVQPGVGEFAITFDYDFISGQWPERAGDPLSDRMRIVLEQGEVSTLLAIETVASSTFTILEGVSLPGSGGTVGHTGWRRGAAVVPVLPGLGSFVVRIEQSGPSSGGSVLLLDRILLAVSPNQLYCGAPQAGSCCEVHENPYCADGACCASVCTVDPTCCTVSWDAACVQIARAVCGDVCPPPIVASTFEGFVKTPDGGPFAGAEVAVGDFTSTADGEGFYSIDAQAPFGLGGVLVTATATFEGRFYVGTALSAEVVPDGVTPVPDIVLGPQGGCFVTGFLPESALFEADGGNGSVEITTSGAICTWSAASSAPWLVITSGATGSGTSGIVTYVVEPNTGDAARTATIVAGGQGHVVTQAAAPPPSTTFIGDVRLADGAPVVDAVVMSDLGGVAITSPSGIYALEVEIDSGVSSVTLSAVATIGGVTYQGSVFVSPVDVGGVNQAPPIVVTPVGGGCQGEYAWIPGIGQPGVNGSVSALAVFDDGTGPALYAGGSFQQAGGVEAYNIARWNGDSWSDVGIGVGGEVRALAVFDDGSGPALYAGGFLEVLVSGPVKGIAKWDGQSWSPVGTGLGNGGQDRVAALAVFDDGTGPALYATGRFTNAGSIGVNRIAKWNGQAWSPVGGGLDGPGSSLVVFDDGSGSALYVGGNFFQAGGVTSPNLARWNGTAWSSLVGQQVGGEVLALAVFDDGSGEALYAGGSFSTAQNGVGNRIARWNGASWSPLGVGMDDRVLSLAVFNDGTGEALYAGGWFTTAGGIAASRIARWDGQSWTPLDEGVNAEVNALVPFDDGSGPALGAGGSFNMAGPWPSSGIAKWGCFTQ